MSAVMDEEIKRWTARRKSALVLEIIQRKRGQVHFSPKVNEPDPFVLEPLIQKLGSECTFKVDSGPGSSK